MHSKLHTKHEHPLLQHFDHKHHAHHAEEVQDVCEHIDALANKLHELLPDGHFKDEALTDLLKCKDDAIRAFTHE